MIILNIGEKILNDLQCEESFIEKLKSTEKYVEDANNVYESILITLKSYENKSIDDGGYLNLLQATISARNAVLKAENKLSKLYKQVYENTLVINNK